ncbi:hypothetical protein GQR58_002300 [Nymphon striatum]|nr:hypothetical protein GQR58_002300 [Nymphon striatum]
MCALMVSFPANACTSPRGASFGVALEAPYIVSGNIRQYTTEVEEYVAHDGDVQTIEYDIVTMDVGHVWHGDHDAPTLVFRLRNGNDFVLRHLGEAVAVALHRDLDSDETWPTLPHEFRRYQVWNDTCADYIFPLDDPANMRGAFLIEIFDGDGDPHEEAEVFDRFYSSRGLY